MKSQRQEKWNPFIAICNTVSTIWHMQHIDFSRCRWLTFFLPLCAAIDQHCLFSSHYIDTQIEVNICSSLLFLSQCFSQSANHGRWNWWYMWFNSVSYTAITITTCCSKKFTKLHRNNIRKFCQYIQQILWHNKSDYFFSCLKRFWGHFHYTEQWACGEDDFVFRWYIRGKSYKYDTNLHMLAEPIDKILCSLSCSGHLDI
jgi:hypothetical protein